MGPHRRLLHLEKLTDVDDGRDLLVGDAELRERVRIEVAWKLDAHVARLEQPADDGVAVRRGLVHARRARQLGRSDTDAVNLDVVGMAVHAVVVVDRQDVGVLLGEDGRQPTGGFVEVGLPEGVGRVVLRCAHHPRVDIAEELDA